MKKQLILLGVLLLASLAQAELITVENITDYNSAATPTGNVAITSDSDVSTRGVLVEAVNFGSVGTGFTWVNGVPFKNIVSGANGVPAGNFIQVVGGTQTAISGLGSTSAPFACLSPNYQALLQEGTQRVGGYINYLQCINLIPGDQYEVQIWLNDSTYSGNYAGSTYSLKEGDGNGFSYMQSGSYVTNTGDMKLSRNNTGVPGGLGSYFLGTFTATGTLPNGGAINILVEPGSLINAAQLRRVPAENGATPSHPRLLVTKDMYPALRAKSGNVPFSTINGHSTPNWNRTLTGMNQWGIEAQSLSCATLEYILDTTGSFATPAQYRQSILDKIDYFFTVDFPTLDAGSWDMCVPPGNPLLNMILALDVIHDDLAPAELAKAEAEVGEVMEWYRHFSQNWTQNKYGLLSAWEIYKGNHSADITDAVDNYVNVWQSEDMKPDGSYCQSPGYLFARTGSGRNAKHWGMDILQFTGQYPWYTDSTMQGLTSFIGSFMLTPFGACQMFGDEVSSAPQDTTQSTILSKMGLYNSLAGSNGKWLLSGTTGATLADDYTCGFMLYATLPDNYSSIVAKMPASTLMDDYGAALWDRTNSTRALMGTLLSYSDSGEALGSNRGHNHHDTNSIHIAGYGQHLIFNSGVVYPYPGVLPGNSGNYDEAWLQNSVLIGGTNNHVNYEGAGLTDGIVGGGIEFGRTDSGRAIAGGVDYRSLLFIQPVAGKSNGYFALLDEVCPNNPADPIKINLHPNTQTGLAAITVNQEYIAPINAYHYGASGSEQVTVFYGTAPTTVNTPSAYHGDTVNGINTYTQLPYLEAVYNTGGDGWLRTATILFPQDATHAKAAMTRTSGTGYTGVVVAHGGGVNDSILQSTGTSLLTNGSVSWQGNTLCYRNDNGTVSSYLVATGCEFNDGASPRSGFISTYDVNVQMDGACGGIETKSGTTTLVFYAPGRTGVQINGTTQSVVTRGDGGLQLDLPGPGEYSVALTLTYLYNAVSWDTSLTSGVQGGSGTWNTVNTNWTVNSGTNNAGWANYSANCALFSGNAGTVTINQAPGGIMANSLTFNVGGYTIAGSGSNGVLALAGSNAGVVATTGTTIISSIISGSDGLTKTGTGTLILSNTSNTLSGAININSGTLTAQNTNAVSSGAFTVFGAATAINLNDGATLAIGQNATGGYGQTYTVASPLSVTGTATLNLFSAGGNSGKIYTFSSLTLNAGCLLNVSDSTNATSRLGATTTTLNGNATIRDQWGSDGTHGGCMNLTAVTVGNSVATSSTTTLTVDGGNLGAVITGTVSNNAADGTKVLALVKSGTGVLTLSASNTFSGNTTLTSGSLVLTNALALQNSTLIHGGGGVLVFGTNAATYTLGGLSGSSNIFLKNNATTPAAITLNVGKNNSSTTYSGILSGSGCLSKMGTGTLTLSGSNTYSGTTTVSAGTLLVGGTSGNGTGNITVAAGAGLGGGGAVSGTTTYMAGSKIPWIISNWSAGPMLTAGTVNISGSVGNPVTVVVSQNALAGFTEGSATFTLLSAASLSASNVVVDATGFTAGVGKWTVQQMGNNLNLVYTTPPTITGTLNAICTIGGGFSYQISVNNGPASYSATGLPDGLVLDAGTGLISGTPSATGTFSTSISATNAGGAATATLTITVLPIPPQITSAASTSGTYGIGLSYQITTTSTAASYWASGLPGGLSLNASTGAISGAPTATGTFNVTLNATNAGGTGTNATLTVTLVPLIASGGWSGGDGSLWYDSLNWSGGIPLTSNTATFSGTANATMDLGVGVTVNTILFDATGAAYTIGAGTVGSQALALDAGGAVVVNSTATSVQTFNANLALSGSASLTVNGGPLTIAGVVSGSSTLIKSGSGMLTLSGSNSYSGGTSLLAGTLNFGNVAALGSGTATYAGNSTLQAGVSGTLANNVAINTGVAGAFDSQAYTVTMSGAVSGSGTLAKTGTGTLILSNTANTLSGAININGGMLWAQNAAWQGSNTAFTILGTSTINLNDGAILRISQTWNSGYGPNYTVASPLVASGTATIDLRPVTGSGNSASKFLFSSLTLNPGSLLNVSDSLNYSNRFAPTITTLSGNATIRDVAGTNGTNGGQINLTNITVGNSVATGSTSTLTVDGGNQGEIITGTISNNATDGTKAMALAKSGTGVLTLSAANTFSGNTTLTSGSLILTNALALQNSTLVYGGAGVLVFGTNSATYTFGGVSGSSNISLMNNAATPAAIALTVGKNNSSTTYSGVLSGAGSLTKMGTGTLALSGFNTYTGTTTVSAGTLQLNTASLADTAAVRLSTGATLNLAHGLTDTISALYIDNVQQASGTWGSLTSSATHKTALISGPGLLKVP